MTSTRKTRARAAMMKRVPGDCNDIARKRAGRRTPPPTRAYERGYAGINWKKSKRGGPR